MSAADPGDKLMLYIDGGERKILGTNDLAKFRAAMGEEVLVGFCRCFIHCDRLLSLRWFGHLSSQQTADSSKARDFHTLIWFGIGTFRELADAIGGLRTALVKKGLFLMSPEWEDLQKIIERGFGERAELRNKGAFHVDRELISKGLDGLAQKSGTKVFSVHEGRYDTGFSFPLATDALYAGIGFPEEEVARFMKNFTSDFDRIAPIVAKLFAETVLRAGIKGFRIP